MEDEQFSGYLLLQQLPPVVPVGHLLQLQQLLLLLSSRRRATPAGQHGGIVREGGVVVRAFDARVSVVVVVVLLLLLLGMEVVVLRMWVAGAGIHRSQGGRHRSGCVTNTEGSR